MDPGTVEVKPVVRRGEQDFSKLRPASGVDGYSPKLKAGRGNHASATTPTAASCRTRSRQWER